MITNRIITLLGLFIIIILDNPVIESTKPAVNTIKYAIPVTNILLMIHTNQVYYNKHSLEIPNYVGTDNNHTVHIPIFRSTFNQPNSSYYVVIENNFVISQVRNEPLLGTNEKTWMFSTSNIHTFF